MMPTTLLEGESWEDAYSRRFREEAEIDERIRNERVPVPTPSSTLDPDTAATAEPEGLAVQRDRVARGG